MAIIEKPIDLINVANTLGYYEYKPHPVTGVNSRYVDLGRLCTHPNVNKYAMYKPVEFDKVEELTEEERKSIDYGWNIPSPINLKDFLAWDFLTNEYWTQRIPTTAKRLSDFEGYEHNSLSLYVLPNIEVIESQHLDANGEFTVKIGEHFYDNAPEGNLRYEDLTKFQQMFYGVIIRNIHSNAVVAVRTAPEKITTNSELSRQIKFKLSNFSTDDYQFYFFLTDYAVYNQVSNINSIPSFYGYPLYYTKDLKNPISVGIIMGLVYPIQVFELWSDGERPVGNTYIQYERKYAFSKVLDEYYTFTNKQGTVSMVASSGMPDDGFNKFWTINMEFAIMQPFEYVGALYNLFTINDIDGDKISLMLRTVSGGALNPHYLEPIFVFDATDEVISTGEYLMAYSNEPYQLKFICESYYNSVRYNLLLNNSVIYTFNVTEFPPIAMNNFVFGYDDTINAFENMAIDARFYEIGIILDADNN